MKPKTLINTNKVELDSPAPTIEPKKINIKSKSDLIITAQEIIKILGISHGTFTKWLNEGRFSGVRMLARVKGATYKFSRSDFEEWLNKSMFS